MSDSPDELSGYIIYRAESEEDRQAKLEEEKRIKELIKQNQGEGAEIQEDGEEEEIVNEKTAAIIKKFKGKILKEFVPFFIPKQYEEAKEQFIEYMSFDECVDEYFS